MRSALGPMLLAGVFLVSGLGLVHAIKPFPGGSIRRVFPALVVAAGLAYLVGLSVLLLIAIALLVAGVSLPFGAFVLLGLGVATLGVVIGWQRGSSVERFTIPPLKRIDRIVLVASAVTFGAFALVSLPEYASAPTVAFDSWAIWTPKAIALFSYDTLKPEFWTAPTYASMHQEYPIFLPMLESLHFRAIGRIDTQSVHDQLWVLLLAFPWALGYLASRSGRAAVWAPIALGAAAAPAIVTVMVSGYADVPLVVFLSSGVLALGLWIDGGDRADLALATILLAGAAGIKQEGLIVGLVALAAAALVRLPDWRRLGELAAAGSVLVLTVLPWELWVSAHDLPKEIHPSNAIKPGFLADHADRVWPSLRVLYSELLDEGRWSFFAPLAILVVVMALVSRRAQRAAAFYLITGVGAFLALLWSFWIAPAPVSYYAIATAPRVVGVVVAVSIAALIHLAPRLAGPARANDNSERGRHTSRQAGASDPGAESTDMALASRT
jgi:hypothetical protein